MGSDWSDWFNPGQSLDISFEFEDSCIRMKKEIADGTLVINFYNMDVLSHQFYDKVCEDLS